MADPRPGPASGYPARGLRGQRSSDPGFDAMTSFVEREIASQPACWREAAVRVGHGYPVLPAAGERVAVIGCGTSWFMAMCYATLRESLGHGWTDAFAASDLPRDRRYDRVVAITRSGTTTEVLDALPAMRGQVPTAVSYTHLTLPTKRIV